jgi:hypothetical protein
MFLYWTNKGEIGKKNWLTAGLIYIVLPTPLHISKYMLFMF